jgi:hypothetical protein
MLKLPATHLCDFLKIILNGRTAWQKENIYTATIRVQKFTKMYFSINLIFVVIVCLICDQNLFINCINILSLRKICGCKRVILAEGLTRVSNMKLHNAFKSSTCSSNHDFFFVIPVYFAICSNTFNRMLW